MVGAGYRRALVDPKRSLAERRLLESDNEIKPTIYSAVFRAM
jgi:hypothetical protein